MRRTSTCAFTTQTLQLLFDSASNFTYATGFIACKYFTIHAFIVSYRLFAGASIFFIRSKCTSSAFARFRAVHISGKYLPTYSLSVWAIWVAGTASDAWKLKDEVFYDFFLDSGTINGTTWTSTTSNTKVTAIFCLSIFIGKNIHLFRTASCLNALCKQCSLNTYWVNFRAQQSLGRYQWAYHRTALGAFEELEGKTASKTLLIYFDANHSSYHPLRITVYLLSIKIEIFTNKN